LKRTDKAFSFIAIRHSSLFQIGPSYVGREATNPSSASPSTPYITEAVPEDQGLLVDWNSKRPLMQLRFVNTALKVRAVSRGERNEVGELL
jgi:hypothetical protein